MTETTITLPREVVERVQDALLAQIHGYDTYEKSHKGDKASRALADLGVALAQPADDAQQVQPPPSDTKARLDLMTAERDKLARQVEELEFHRTHNFKDDPVAAQQVEAHPTSVDETGSVVVDTWAQQVAVPKSIHVTEAMHRAAVKVLNRAHGVDGLPQRMMDAMLATAGRTTLAPRGISRYLRPHR